MATKDLLVARADALAVRIHAGQADKGGHPYIEHPRRVARAVEAEGEEAVIAALLHDVVEDGGLSVDELRTAGMPETSIAAIVTVTKQADEHGSEEGYRRFIERIATSGSRLAIVVKLGDLADNADLTRLGRTPTPKDEVRAAKYAAARTRLEEALSALDGRSAAPPAATWHLSGYDTFAGERYPLGGEYPTEAAAREAAWARLARLAATQPEETSGGQAGMQDRVYIHHPDGRVERVVG